MSTSSGSASESGGSSSGRWRGKRLGKFRLLSLLGRGSMGKVFLAEDTTLKRQVAIKVMSIRGGAGESTQQKKQVQQFVREARAAAKLSHPHIVNILEIDQQQELIFIAMDLVQGGDVKRLIDDGGALPVGRACDLGADAAEALAFAHHAGVLHRDVKPGNLMLTRDGRCKLADFGLADLGDPNDTFRLPAGVIGTPHTMAPEVARGLPALPASDQYSLGCTVWHMLAGEHVFPGTVRDYKEVLEKQVHATPPPLRELVPDVPAKLALAVERTLAKDPEARFPGVEDFGRVLRAHAIALGPSASVSAGMSGAVLEAVVGPRRRPRWAVPAGVAVVALGLGTGGTFLALSGSGDAGEARVESAAAVVATPERPPASREAAARVTDESTDSPGPIEVLAASETDRLKALEDRDAVVTVEGVVARAYTSQSGKTFLVKFEGNGRGDFQVIWRPPHFDAMAAAFGGTHGDAIAGQTIRVTGELSSMFGAPQIAVTSPEQVEIVGE
ncbi:MAG: serine/threonine-protein kinase [Planctomycetota bacterium]